MPIVRARRPKDIDREKRKNAPHNNVTRLPTVIATPHHLKLTDNELEELATLLVEEADRMDDDGREGAFAKSPLAPIYDKVKTLRRTMKG